MTPSRSSAFGAAALLAATLLGPPVQAQGMFGAFSTDSAAAPGGAYTLDKSHASVTMRITHMGLSHYPLRFRALEGSYGFDPKNPGASKIQVSIDPKSIETLDPKFNEEIAGKFFEADKFPQISFVSTGVTPQAGGRGKVAGRLTFHGVTKPVVLDVIYNGARTGMRGQDRMGFSAVTTVRRSEFGVAPGLPTAVLSDDVAVMIEAEFVKPSAGTGAAPAQKRPG